MTTYYARIALINVIDGDTYRCTIDLGWNIDYRVTVRLRGYNAPETKGVEKEAGKAVSQFVRGWIERQAGNALHLQSDEWDKYGRSLGDILADQPDGRQVSLAEVLLSGGLVKPYDGKGPRPEFSPEECAQIVEKVSGLLPIE